MSLPDFLIVGAMKCGTTALRSYLQQHPEIYIAPRAIHFFDREENYERGLGWYERHFERGGAHRAIGEKTPGYCFKSLAPERIHRHLPRTKLIFILRDPVARAYSHYWHRLRRGKERIAFEAVLAQGLAEERTLGQTRCEVLSRGRYAEQVQRYLQFFSRDQMHFILAEDFLRDSRQDLRRIFELIGVSADASVDFNSLRNTGYVPRSSPLVWYSRKLFKGSFPYQLISRLNRGARTSYPPMADETREQLQHYYRPHNRALADLLGWDLSAWEQGKNQLRREEKTGSGHAASPIFTATMVPS